MVKTNTNQPTKNPEGPKYLLRTFTETFKKTTDFPVLLDMLKTLNYLKIIYIYYSFDSCLFSPLYNNTSLPHEDYNIITYEVPKKSP